MGALCREASRLGVDALRAAAPLAVALAVEKMASSGDLRALADLLREAGEAGLLTPELAKLRDQVEAVLELESTVKQLAVAVEKAVEALSRGEEYDASELENLARRVESLASKASGLVDTGGLAGLVDVARDLAEASRYVGLVRDVRGAAEEAEEAIRSALSTLKSSSDVDALTRTALALANLSRYAERLTTALSRLEALKPRTRRVAEAVEAVVEIAKPLRDMTAELASVGRNALEAAIAIQNFISAAGNYGGLNVLANPEYRERVTTILVKALKWLGNLERIPLPPVELPQKPPPGIPPDRAAELAKPEYSELPERVRRALAAALKSVLDSLKRGLASRDVRWLRVFEEAESRAGYHLVDVPVEEALRRSIELYLEESGEEDEEGLLEKLSEWLSEGVEKAAEEAEKLLAKVDEKLSSVVNDIIETNRAVAEEARNPLLKALGLVGTFGASIIDAFTSFVRPTAWAQNLAVVKEMAGRVAEGLRSGGVRGAASEAKRILEEMLGSPADAAAAAGYLAAAFIASKIASGLFPETRFGRLGRAVVENLLQGDLPFAVADVILEAVPVREVAGRLAKFVEEGKVSLKALIDDAGIMARASEAFEKTLRKRLAVEIPALTEYFKRYASKLDSVTEIEEAVRKAAVEEGLGRLREMAERYAEARLELAAAASELTRDAPGILSKGRLDVLASLALNRVAARVAEGGLEGLSARLSEVAKRLAGPEKLAASVASKAAELAKAQTSFRKLVQTVEALAESVPKVDVGPFAKAREALARVSKLAEEAEARAAGLEKAAAELGSTLSRITRLGELRGVLGRVAELFREAGLADLASRLERASSVEEAAALVAEGLERVRSALDAERLTLLNKVARILAESGLPELDAAMKRVLKTIREDVLLDITDEPLVDLSRAALPLLEEIRKAGDALPEDVRAAVSVLLGKAREGKLTLSDLQALADALAKLSPEAAAALDLAALRNLLGRVMDALKRYEGVDPAVAGVVRRFEKELSEVEGRLYTGKGATVEAEIRRLYTGLSESVPMALERLADDIEELYADAKPLADRLRSLAARLREAAARGEVAPELLMEIAGAVSDVARKVPGVRPGVRDTLAATFESLRGLARRVAAKLGRGAAHSLAEAIERLADEIVRDARLFGEVPEGYVYLARRVEVARGLPLAVPASEYARILSVLSQPVKEWTATVEGVPVKVRRVIERSTNTLSVTYTFELPGGRRFMYRRVAKAAPDGYVDVYESFTADPPARAALAEALEAAEEGVGDPALRRIGGAFEEILRRGPGAVDPDFELLSRIAVKSRDGWRILGDSWRRAAEAFASSLYAAAEAGGSRTGAGVQPPAVGFEGLGEVERILSMDPAELAGDPGALASLSLALAPEGLARLAVSAGIPVRVEYWRGLPPFEGYYLDLSPVPVLAVPRSVFPDIAVDAFEWVKVDLPGGVAVLPVVDLSGTPVAVVPLSGYTLPGDLLRELEEKAGKLRIPRIRITLPRPGEERERKTGLEKPSQGGGGAEEETEEPGEKGATTETQTETQAGAQKSQAKATTPTTPEPGRPSVLATPATPGERLPPGLIPLKPVKPGALKASRHRYGVQYEELNI